MPRPSGHRMPQPRSAPRDRRPFAATTGPDRSSVANRPSFRRTARCRRQRPQIRRPMAPRGRTVAATWPAVEAPYPAIGTDGQQCRGASRSVRGQTAPVAWLAHLPVVAAVARLKQAEADRPGPRVIGICRVDCKGVQIQSRQVVGDRLPARAAVDALHVHVVSGDLDFRCAGDLDVHGVRARQRRRLPRPPPSRSRAAHCGVRNRDGKRRRARMQEHARPRCSGWPTH